MGRRGKGLTLAVCLVGVTAFYSGVAQAQTTLRLAHASSSASLIDQAVQRFADEVKQATGGQLLIQDFPDGQLGDEGPIAEGVGSGSIDIGLGGVVDAIDPSLMSWRCLSCSATSPTCHAFLDGPQGQKLKALGQDRGYVMLGFLDSGFRNFANQPASNRRAGRPSRNEDPHPADTGDPRYVKALGALPQAIPFGQVYTALQSHVVDGIEPEIRDFQDQKWFEAAKFLTISNYIWTANFWLHEQGPLRCPAGSAATGARQGCGGYRRLVPGAARQHICPSAG